MPNMEYHGMPHSGDIALPPLLFRRSGGRRLSDSCRHCGLAGGPRRGFWTHPFAGEGECCNCPPTVWSYDDTAAHNEYVSLCQEWEESREGDDYDDEAVADAADEQVCTCPDCTARRSQGRAAETLEERTHRQYRDSIRSAVLEQRRMAGHRSNPAGYYRWNGQARAYGRPRVGLEFECDARTVEQADDLVFSLNSAWQALGFRHADNYCIRKTDGSVTGSCPIELVTVPCTAQEHRSILDRAYPSGRLGNGNLRAWNNNSCGLHVHHPRTGVSPLLAGKVGVWMHHPRNAQFLSDLSGREANGFCKRLPAALRERDTGRGDRYVAFNRSNPRTFEFRLFRPSPKNTSIVKNMEFCESVFEFCKWSPICGTTGDSLQSDWREYLRWLAQPAVRKKYEHLHYWMLSKAGEYGVCYRSMLPINVRSINGVRRRGFGELTRGEDD